MGLNPPHTNPVTSSAPPRDKPNNTFFTMTGLPAVVKQHDKNSVVIAGKRLGEMLEKLYNAGIRNVELTLEIDGRHIVVAGSVYRKINKHTGRSYYYIYPLGADQILLRERYLAFRGAAEPYSRTPLPVIVYSVVPKF